MREIYNKKYDLPMTMILPGELYACNDTRIIFTLLGSCVSICLSDKVNKVYGMNHFMLPGEIENQNLLHSASGRYGFTSMELLIGEMIKLGCKRKNLTAKIFGGGNVSESISSQLSIKNISFAKAFLELEDITIEGEDTGGKSGRKLMFFTNSGKSFIKKLKPDESREIIYNEKEYKNRVENTKLDKSKIVIFKDKK